MFDVYNESVLPFSRSIFNFYSNYYVLHSFEFERAEVGPRFNDTAHEVGHARAQYRRQAGEPVSSPYRYRSPSRSPSRTLYNVRIRARTGEREYFLIR